MYQPYYGTVFPWMGQKKSCPINIIVWNILG